MPRGNQLHTKVVDKLGVVGYFEDERLDLACFWLLVHVVDQASLTLDTAIGNLADFLRVECLPRLVVQVFVEWHDVDRIDEIYEGVANITAII